MKKYYIADDSLDLSLIGSNYPQAYSFIKGYDENAPHAICDLYNYVDHFPNFTPNLDGIKLAGYAQKTDFISGGYGDCLQIISPAAKVVLEKYKLCSHRFYEMSLYIRRKMNDYFMLHYIPDYVDYVDYRKSSFIELHNWFSERGSIIPIVSKEDLLRKKKIMKQKNSADTIWGNTIVMNDEFSNMDLDFFSLFHFDSNLYVSERLMNAIIENGLTGWEFKPATNLMIE